MKNLERHQHRERRPNGQYKKTHLCDCCNKPVGTAFFTDDEVCQGSDDPGFYLCERKACVAKREKLSVDDRRALYNATHATRG